MWSNKSKERWRKNRIIEWRTNHLFTLAQLIERKKETKSNDKYVKTTSEKSNLVRWWCSNHTAPNIIVFSAVNSMDSFLFQPLAFEAMKKWLELTGQIWTNRNKKCTRQITKMLAERIDGNVYTAVRIQFCVRPVVTLEISDWQKIGRQMNLKDFFFHACTWHRIKAKQPSNVDLCAILILAPLRY